MNYRGMTGHQIMFARRNLCNEIARTGHIFTAHVPLFKDDGCGGKIRTGEFKKEIKGILVNGEQSSNAKMKSDDGKRRYNTTYALICLYGECAELEFATRIECKNRVYHVVKIEDVDMMGVCWRISLTHTNSEMEAYDGGEGRS